MSTSFPYLAVARRHNVPYGLVLWFADQHDEDLDFMEEPPERFRPAMCGILRWSSRWHLEPWATATSAAWMREQGRRRGVA